MKKLIPIIIIVLALLGIGYNLLNKDSSPTTPNTSFNNSDNLSTQKDNNNFNTEDQQNNFNLEGQDANQEDTFEDIKPASIAYKDANEALNAIKKGAVDYDDTILEQFTTPGADCAFCPELYNKVKDLLNDPSIKNEEKAFYAEILAISGKPENIKSLIDQYKNAGNDSEKKELLTSALELSTGGDDVVNLLSSELSTDNPDLKESIVAALTNQDSVLAFNTLFEETIKSGNPDGFSSLGIGVSEMMLNDDALEEARKRAAKKDAYSNLAVKAMLNNGLVGLRMVFDILATSNNPEKDRMLIKDAVEHVGYDEQIEKYLKEKLNSSTSALAKEFAQKILDDYAQQEEALDGDANFQDNPINEAPMTKNR